MQAYNITALNGVTSTSTSNAVGIGDARQVSIQFSAASISSGNGVFTVQVSNDDSNWTAYNRLNSNVTNTNAQTDLRVASVTLNSNTSSVVTLPISDSFQSLRVICTVTTDGAYTARVHFNK